MKKAPRFVKLMGYEFKRVLRNRAVAFMLLSFAVLLVAVLFVVQSADMDYPIALYSESQDAEQSEVCTFLQKTLGSNFTRVESPEEGITMIRKDEAVFFLLIERESEDGPFTATIYYDEANRIARGLAYDLLEAKANEAYRVIIERLESYGVTEDQAYFNPLSVRPIGKIFRYAQLAFVMEIAVVVSLILMLGLAYSISRDRETKISKNLAYLPIGRNEYLLSKLIPYFMLGMVQALIVLAFGKIIMKIEFMTNLFLVWLASTFFVTATLSLGLLFSTMKSQISTVFLDMIAILIPIFLQLLVIVEASPLAVKVFCYCFPIMPFMQLAKGMIYNGVVIWMDIPILIAHTVVYYVGAFFALKRRAE